LDNQVKNLNAIGYKAKGENGISGRRYFQKGDDKRTHHIHAFISGDENITRHLAFKAYLIAHPDIAKSYDLLKRKAVLNCNNDTQLYMSLKNNFIQHHEKLALSWFSS